VLEQNITQLSEDIGLPPPSGKDANGCFAINFSDTLTVSLKELSPGCTIFSFVAPVPKNNKEEILIHVMKANFSGQGTGEQVMGIDDEEKFLTLSRTISYEINYIKFKETLEDFVNYLSYWKNEIQKMATEHTMQ